MSQEHSSALDLARNAQREEMALHGISCIPIDNFYYREFHYTNLKDAIAQATRDKVRSTLSATA